jgi:hypothetical protein
LQVLLQLHAAPQPPFNLRLSSESNQETAAAAAAAAVSPGAAGVAKAEEACPAGLHVVARQLQLLLKAVDDTTTTCQCHKITSYITQ